MKILLAVDGSKYAQKMLDFIVKHRELLVMRVRTPLPTGFNVIMGFDKAQELHDSEAKKILTPVQEFLEKNSMKYRCVSAVDPVVKDIVDAARNKRVDLLLMGSVPLRVIADSNIPALRLN